MASAHFNHTLLTTRNSLVHRENRVPYYQRLFQAKDGKAIWLKVCLKTLMSHALFLQQFERALLMHEQSTITDCQRPGYGLWVLRFLGLLERWYVSLVKNTEYDG